jgi:hypothetical protein
VSKVLEAFRSEPSELRASDAGARLLVSRVGVRDARRVEPEHDGGQDDPRRPSDQEQATTQLSGWLGASARSSYSSILLLCPFRHNTTLQHFRLLGVTTTVTRFVIRARSVLPSKIHIPRTYAMYACTLEIGRGFFEGVCAPMNASAFSATHPLLRLTLREWFLRQQHLRSFPPQ